MKKIILLHALMLTTLFVGAQGFEPARKLKYLNLPSTKEIIGVDGTKSIGSDSVGGGAEILQQLAINVTNSTPRINIKAVKLYAQVGKQKFIDFYILSSIPTITTNPGDSAKNLGNELQNLYGGLLNSYFAQTFYFNKEDDYQTRGLQIDAKGGFKLTETSKNSGTKNIYLPSGQLATEFRFLIPLFGKPTDENLAGLVQLKLNGQMLYTNNADYDNFFETDDGKKPSSFLFSSNVEGSVHIFDQFYVSGGYSFGSISTIEDTGYLKLTYSRK